MADAEVRALRRALAVVGLALLGVAGLVGCADHGSKAGLSADAARAATPKVSYPSPGTDQEYEAWATVLQTRGGEAELCLSGVRLSLPPQCDGGPPITNWDWNAAPPSKTQGGAHWGDYHVQGTFNGEEFTLTTPPDRADRPKQPGEPRDHAATPCAPPAGGWAVVDPSKITDEHALIAAAKAQPDFGGVWFDDLGIDSDGGYKDPSTGVFTISFTGDLGRHETELRRVWGGPLCVTLAPATKEALEAAADQMLADQQSDEFDGVEVTGVGVNDMHGSLDVGVLWAPAGTEAALSERYGVPVHLGTALHPIT